MSSVSQNLISCLIVLLIVRNVECGSVNLPMSSGTCPSLSEGVISFNIQGVARSAKFWMDPNKQGGPLIFHWHGTGQTPDEAIQGGEGIPLTIRENGGILVAPFSILSGPFQLPWSLVGNSNDAFFMDEIVACAAGRIDPNRIHSIGFSAGGLASAKFSMERSNYIASVVLFSGGISPFHSYSFQNPESNVDAMVFWGGEKDVVIISFEEASWNYHDRVLESSPSHYILMCNHNQGHRIPTGVYPAVWEFLKAHPFGTFPSPFSKELPSSVPEYCVKTPQTKPQTPAESALSCLEGTFYNSTAKICQNCPDNSFSPAQSPLIEQCTCLPGYFGPDGQTCEICPGGTYKVVSGNAECTTCPKRTSSLPGSSSLSDCLCAPGYTSLETFCVPCREGTYKNDIGVHPCIPCPGKTFSNLGASSVEECTCPPNQYGSDCQEAPVDTSTRVVAGVSVGVIVALLLIILVVGLILWHRKRNQSRRRGVPIPDNDGELD